MVDNDGNYLMGGHTTVGEGVQNWDYLALKVDKDTRQVLWRKTFGEPRGFDPRCSQLVPLPKPWYPRPVAIVELPPA